MRMGWLSRVLHTYVVLHAGMFNAPEKELLKVFLDTKHTAMPQSTGKGRMVLDVDKLWILENTAT